MHFWCWRDALEFLHDSIRYLAIKRQTSPAQQLTLTHAAKFSRRDAFHQVYSLERMVVLPKLVIYLLSGWPLFQLSARRLREFAQRKALQKNTLVFQQQVSGDCAISTASGVYFLGIQIPRNIGFIWWKIRPSESKCGEIFNWKIRKRIRGYLSHCGDESSLKLLKLNHTTPCFQKLGKTKRIYARSKKN